jgi:peroxiredoxin Q/BCP
MVEPAVVMKVGDGGAPDFCLPDKDRRNVCLHDFKGTWVVLYFYPRDNTRGCTREALAFTQALEEFAQLNAVVIGMSGDSVESHGKFIQKHNLTVTLLSDTTHEILERYGVWQRKQLYGKEFWGTVRSTFLISPGGKIAEIWRNVKVEGHVEAVKRRLVELQAA